MQIRFWNSARKTHSSSQPESRDGATRARPLVIHRSIQTEPQVTHDTMRMEPADIDMMTTASMVGLSPPRYDTEAQGNSECSPPAYACPNFPLSGSLGLDWAVLIEEAQRRDIEPTYYELALAYNGGENAWEVAAEINKSIIQMSKAAARSCRVSWEPGKAPCDPCDQHLVGVTYKATEAVRQLSNAATADLANVLFVAVNEAAVTAASEWRIRAGETGCTHAETCSQDCAKGPLTWCQMAAPADE
ncbi:uncharacterized protein E0L32_012297 [Thyridium curvatum]|uniref:Uncharacterized protein n=1 Tax=Thyridium curvatum TaxID=1093900 RepID=A0A507BK38_9PEZI|nr:uncharacterized protein E0L32_012297 [Thyridium curvatum]TPX17040.1 hypothetical protein E0L32_012297 [Thyridium curvatum]